MEGAIYNMYANIQLDKDMDVLGLKAGDVIDSVVYNVDRGNIIDKAVYYDGISLVLLSFIEQYGKVTLYD